MTTSSARASRENPSPRSPAPESPPPRDPIEELALARFGVGYLYPIQRYVVSNVLEGHSQIVVLPTGAGKSLCFQLPSLLLRGPTLVLMPLLSLISDQLRKLGAAGIPVECLRGGLPDQEKARIWSSLRSGGTRILLATPEACLVRRHLALLEECGFAHVVIDEAHCVSEWGESFRPAYLRLGEITRRLNGATISAFTATASREVRERIRALLFGDAEVRIVGENADRPGISYSVQPVLSRSHALAHLLRTAERPLLVFCRTRAEAEMDSRAARLRSPQTPVFFYHAGLSREERSAVEAWFLSTTSGALFATCAYGMGVDKPDIRTVVHAGIPGSVEAYLQESGRAGRDGRPARAVLLLSRREEEARASRLPDPVARRRFERMLGYAVRDDACRRNTLLALIGQDPVACAGCDVCRGPVSCLSPGEREILDFLGRHPRRFTLSEAAQILCGARSPRSIRGFHDCLPGWSSLPDWRAGDVEMALHSLAAAGRLRVIARGPWKGRLTTLRA